MTNQQVELESLLNPPPWALWVLLALALFVAFRSVMNRIERDLVSRGSLERSIRSWQMRSPTLFSVTRNIWRVLRFVARLAVPRLTVDGALSLLLLPWLLPSFLLGRRRSPLPSASVRAMVRARLYSWARPFHWRNVVCWAGAFFAHLYLGQLALSLHDERVARRKAGVPPRLVWGPYPNATILDIDKALRRVGLQMDSYLYYNFDRIWKGMPFTFVLTDRYPPNHWLMRRPWREIILYPKIFAELIRNYDVFHGNFYEGYLRGSWLEKKELQLLKLAGCRRVSISVGGDVTLMDRIESNLIRQGYLDMYPETAAPKMQRRIQQWIDYYCKHSDLVVCQNSYMIDALPRWDILLNSYVPIDLEKWRSDFYTDHDGRNGPVTIGHSPNHRALKGTNFLIRAVNELRKEGLRIELALLEKMQNDEVREVLGRCDIAVADLVLQGYSLMAIEGLALGRPVVQDISDEHYNRVFKLYTPLGEAPFVSVRLEELKDALRTLAADPGLRRELGRKGRAYVEKYHSYEAMGRLWSWIYDYTWNGRRERISFYHPDWPISTVSSAVMSSSTAEEQRLAEATEAALKYQRARHRCEQVGIFPFDERASAVVASLAKASALRSTDMLVLRPGAGTVPPGAMQLPQSCVDLEEFVKRGGKMLLLLENTEEIERYLAFLEWHRYPISVNDLPTTQYAAGEPIKKPYRLLTMEYSETVVPPLHFSNYAYIQHLKSIARPEMRVLDICTGPGTVGLALFKEARIRSLDLVDINPAAITCCKINIARNFGPGAPIQAHLSDVFAAFQEGGVRREWDLIIGNPPHNLDPGNIRDTLTRDEYVQAHDPNLEFHRKFFAQAMRHLPIGGRICLLENGDDDCIQIRHLEELLSSMPQYGIAEWGFLPASQFYQATIVRRS